MGEKIGNKGITKKEKIKNGQYFNPLNKPKNNAMIIKRTKLHLN